MAKVNFEEHGTLISMMSTPTIYRSSPVEPVKKFNHHTFNLTCGADLDIENIDFV